MHLPWAYLIVLTIYFLLKMEGIVYGGPIRGTKKMSELTHVKNTKN